MNSNVRKRFVPLASVVAVILALAVPVAAGAQQILPGPPTSLPVYIGAPAEAHPLPPVQVPQNPFLALNPWNNVHNDAWMSDVYGIAGPMGRQAGNPHLNAGESAKSAWIPLFHMRSPHL